MSLLGFNTYLYSDDGEGITLEDGITCISPSSINVSAIIGEEFTRHINIYTNDNSTLKGVSFTLLSSASTNITLTFNSISDSTATIDIKYFPIAIETGTVILRLTVDGMVRDLTISYTSSLDTSTFIVVPSSISFGELVNVDFAEDTILITCSDPYFDPNLITYFINGSNVLQLYNVSITKTITTVSASLKVLFKPTTSSLTNLTIFIHYNDKVISRVPVIGSKSTIVNVGDDVPPTTNQPTAPLVPVNMLVAFKNTSEALFRLEEIIIIDDTYNQFELTNMPILLGSSLFPNDVIYIAILYTPKILTLTYPNVSIKGISFNSDFIVLDYVTFNSDDITNSTNPSSPSIPTRPSIPIAIVEEPVIPVTTYEINTDDSYSTPGSTTKEIVLITQGVPSGTILGYTLTTFQVSPANLVTFSTYSEFKDISIKITFSNFGGNTTVSSSAGTWDLMGTESYFHTSFFNQNVGNSVIPFTFHPSGIVVDVIYTVKAVIPMTYSIATSEPYTHLECTTKIFTVNTPAIPNGTYLNWDTIGVTGVSASDFSDNTLTGKVYITHNTGTISRTLTLDSVTEANEEYSIQVYGASVYEGVVQCVSHPILMVADTTTYSITTQTPYTQVEGTTREFTITTTGLPALAYLYWGFEAVSGSVNTGTDFGISMYQQSTIRMDNNVGTISIPLNLNAVTVANSGINSYALKIYRYGNNIYNESNKVLSTPITMLVETYGLLPVPSGNRTRASLWTYNNGSPVEPQPCSFAKIPDSFTVGVVVGPMPGEPTRFISVSVTMNGHTYKEDAFRQFILAWNANTELAAAGWGIGTSSDDGAMGVIYGPLDQDTNVVRSGVTWCGIALNVNRGTLPTYTITPKVVFSSYNVAQNQSINITLSDFGDDTSVTGWHGSWGLLTPVTYQPQLTMTASNVDFFNQWLGNSVIPFTFHPSERTVNVNYTVTPAVDLTIYNTVLDADKTSVHEGEDITYTFTTTANVVDGTTIVYILTESTLDFNNYTTIGTGTLVLINKSASVTYSPLAGSLARGIRTTGLYVGVNHIRSYVANLVA